MHQLLQDGLHYHLIVLSGGLSHLHQYGREFGPSHKIFVCLHDALMRGALRIVANQQLFLELFPGSTAGNLDLDITVRIAFVPQGET